MNQLGNLRNKNYKNLQWLQVFRSLLFVFYNKKHYSISDLNGYVFMNAVTQCIGSYVVPQVTMALSGGFTFYLRLVHFKANIIFDALNKVTHS